MDQKHATSLTAAGFFVALMLVLAFFSWSVPIFSSIGAMALAFVLPVFAVRYGWQQALAAGVLPVLFLATLFDPYLAVMHWGLAALLGFAVGVGMQRKYDPVYILLAVAGTLIALTVLTCVAAYLFWQINIFTVLQQWFGEIVDMAFASYQQSNPGSVQLMSLHQQMEMLKETVPALIPLEYCLGLVVMVYLSLRVAQYLLTRQGISVRPFMPVRLWEIPRCMVYLYVLALVMKYWGVSRSIDWLSMIAVNVDHFSAFFITLQGVAFILYLLHRRTPLRSATQAMLIVITLVIPIFQMVAFILGLVDMLFNYRKKREAA